MTVTALLGKLLDEVGVEVPFGEVEVGDEVLFASYGFHGPYVVDTDEVVKVDEKGVHFAGGSYLATVEDGGKPLVVVADLLVLEAVAA